DKKDEQETKKYLKQKFEVKDLGNVKNCLGMTIERDRDNGKLRIHQAEYIKEILKRFRMEECNPVYTPMDPNVKLTKNMEIPEDEENEHKKENMESVPYLEA
ncbi:hypothetical protein KPH14_012189, partial [Odynerus spinipes]